MAGTPFLSVFLVTVLFSLCVAEQRKFSNDLLVGFYGRFLELVPGESPSKECSDIIQHFDTASPVEPNVVSIPQQSITHSGNRCESGQMVMRDTPAKNPLPGVGDSDQIFQSFSKSDGFWVGESNRNCGKWVLPKPTAVFMVYDETNTLDGPYGIPLPPKNKYIILTNAKYTCAYRDVPRPTPRPDSGGDNSAVATPVGGTLAEPGTSTPSNPTEEASPEASSEEDDGSVCFPADAIVELENGSFKTMETLAVGDRVRVGPKAFSDVFMFTHKLASVSNEFVKISTSQTGIKLTRGHYLYVNGALAAAKTVKTGDLIELASGEVVAVDSVSVEKGTGLYNPQTVSGDIVVNNVRASTYTTTVEPSLAHLLLLPVRAAYIFFGVSTSVFDEGGDSLAKMIPSGLAMY